MVVVQVGDHHVFYLRGVDLEQPQGIRRTAQVLASALARHGRRETGVDHDLATLAAHQPHEIVERHGPVVRIAADEVFRGAPRVVRILERVDLVGHFTVTRANFRLPTCTVSVLPAGSRKLRSVTRSPSILTPPCSMARAASDVLAASCASLRSCATCNPPAGLCRVICGMSSGSTPWRKLLSDSVCASSAAALPWERTTISLADAALTFRRVAVIASCFCHASTR